MVELLIALLFITLRVFTTNVYKNCLLNISCLPQAIEIKQEESNQVKSLLFLILNTFLV